MTPLILAEHGSLILGFSSVWLLGLGSILAGLGSALSGWASVWTATRKGRQQSDRIVVELKREQEELVSELRREHIVGEEIPVENDS